MPPLETVVPRIVASPVRRSTRVAKAPVKLHCELTSVMLTLYYVFLPAVELQLLTVVCLIACNQTLLTLLPNQIDGTAPSNYNRANDVSGLWPCGRVATDS